MCIAKHRGIQHFDIQQKTAPSSDSRLILQKYFRLSTRYPYCVNRNTWSTL
ncbi:protein of unassigned function [Methylobacterium oryzae CBMB20]|uniref:Protein of unassigned function n=1 Tax=Methylobacterium oryzae CBMB20 TaxID=693986 RepID=A0A089NN70_9HYPH|nr:protein of unassigned function [Methylobacterium oryzae CBMB20]